MTNKSFESLNMSCFLMKMHEYEMKNYMQLPQPRHSLNVFNATKQNDRKFVSLKDFICFTSEPTERLE